MKNKTTACQTNKQKTEKPANQNPFILPEGILKIHVDFSVTKYIS